MRELITQILKSFGTQAVPYLVTAVMVWVATAGGCNHLQSIKHRWEVRRAVAKARNDAEQWCYDNCDCGKHERRKWWQILRADRPAQWWFPLCDLGVTDRGPGIDWVVPDLPEELEPEPMDLPDPAPEPTPATPPIKVVMHSMDGCMPCVRWESEQQPIFERNGVVVEVMKDPGFYPFYRVTLPDGQKKVIKGFVTYDKFSELIGL